MPRRNPDLGGLLDRLGHPRSERVEQALTHSTAREGQAIPDNRSLAFVGDAVIELLVREACYEDKTGARRGELSVQADQFVPDHVLAKKAESIQLEDYLDVGRGESKNDDGRQRRLADAMEALAGALYLDRGSNAFPAIRRLLGL